jgi:hypothetical protein
MFLSGGGVGYTTIAMELPGQPICRHRPLVSVKVETTFLQGAAMSPRCLDVVALPVAASSPQRHRLPLALINAAIFYTHFLAA